MWKWWWLYCVLLHISVLALEKKTTPEMSHTIILIRAFKNWIFDAFGTDLMKIRESKFCMQEFKPRSFEEIYIYQRVRMDENYLQIARNANKMQKIIPDNVPFPCNVTGGRSPTVPESVHKLRPGDIDVIAAIGDSLTNGVGIFANNPLELLVENRGVAAAGGGQGTWREYLTLPNIIKEFNPNLVGYALGDSSTPEKASQLNVAESGAASIDTMYMVEVLIEKIKNDPRIDLQKHWKFISLMIGANNFCSEMCWISSPRSILEKHKVDLLQALRTLRDKLPRTFVALIPPPNIKIVVDSRKGRQSYTCSLLMNFECACMFVPAFQDFKPIYYEIMQRWQELDMEIAAYPEFQRDDFVVVAQPTMMDMSIPPASDGYADMTYLSVDCFHMSQKGNAGYAHVLWNNLLEPVGAKISKWDNLNKFLCPTAERPYLATMSNSK